MNGIHVRGATSLKGKRYIEVHCNGKVALLKQVDLIGSPRDIFFKLALRGMAIIGRQRQETVIQEASAVDDWPERPIIDEPGWNGAYFTLPDGSTFGPRRAAQPILAFDPQVGKCANAGTLAAWLQGVAAPCIGQPVPMFALAFAFAPPLLRFSEIPHNFGFELVGAKGTGKSTLQMLAASVVGPTNAGQGQAYWTTFHATLNRLDHEFTAHSDLPMIIDEAALLLADQSKRARAAAFQALAFQVSTGSGKARLGTLDISTYRTVYLISTNERLADLTGSNTETARAAEDRLITLEIPPLAPYGVFERVPTGYPSSSHFARALTDAAARNHGHAMQHFLKRLVKERARDEDRLRRRIAHLLDQFRQRAAIDPNDGSAVRVASAFGLVYAAGALAKKWGCLPAEWHIGPAILHCYQRYRYTPTARPSFSERLCAAASANTTVKLKSKRLPTPDLLQRADTFVHRGRYGRELLVRAEAIERVFPQWRSIRRSDEVKRLLINEGGRQQTKRRLHPTMDPVRFFVFKLDR